MIKKYFLPAAGVALLLLLVGGFAASDREKTEHYHAWYAESQTQATCERDGETTVACSCGEYKLLKIPAVGHTYTTVEAKSATCEEVGRDAYERCAVCGESNGDRTEYPALGHDLIGHEGNAATCEYGGWAAYETCTRCEYSTFEEIPALGHDEVVEESLRAVTCLQDGSELRTCVTCGETRAVIVESLGHDIRTVAAKAADCRSAGWTEHEACSRCAYTTKTEIPLLAHTWNEGEETEFGLKKICMECGEDEIEGHTHVWDESEIAVESTCFCEGEEILYCACGEIEIRSIPMLDHEYALKEGVEPTCDKVGFTDGWFCSVCDKILEAREILPKADHIAEIIEGKEATCTISGKTDGERCEACGKILTKQQEIEPYGHDWDEGEDTIAGIMRTCMRCGEVRIDGAAHVHDYDETEIIKQPTCREGGEEKRICACGSEKTELLAALGHDYESGFCNRCGEFAENSSDDRTEQDSSTEDSSLEDSVAINGGENKDDESDAESKEESGDDTESSAEDSADENDAENSDEKDEENADANGLLYRLNTDKNGYVCDGFAEKDFSRVVIPSDYNGLPVTEIGAGAFSEAYRLNRITIGKNIEKVAADAFFNCPNVVEICNLSSLSIKKLGGLRYCELATVYTEECESGLQERSDGFITYQKDSEVYLVGYSGAGTDEADIPENVTTIRPYVFVGCSLKRIAIPETVRMIMNYAFINAEELQEVVFEITTGWSAGNVSITADELANATKAAEYLKESYAVHVWALSE